MMNIQFAAGLVIGGVITWLITHVYYRKANADQNIIYSKLSKEMRDAILLDSREKLSVKELNDLITQKTIDPESRAPFPYKACPKCGSEKLRGGEFTDYTRDESYWTLRCEDCGWNDWTQ